MWLFEGLQINRAWYPVTLRPMLSHVSSAKLRFPTYHLPLVFSTVVRTRTLVHFTSPNTISGAGKLQVKKKKKKKEELFLKLLLFPQHLTGRWIVNRCESSSAAKKNLVILPAVKLLRLKELHNSTLCTVYHSIDTIQKCLQICFLFKKYKS